MPARVHRRQLRGRQGRSRGLRRLLGSRRVDPARLDPELLDFTKRRAAQKAKYGGELFPAESRADPAGTRFRDYFQQDKTTGEPKGIVALDLGDLP
ncbi:MAG: DUF6932 family protein [Stackebrandtia sp.]